MTESNKDSNNDNNSMNNYNKNNYNDNNNRTIHNINHNNDNYMNSNREQNKQDQIDSDLYDIPDPDFTRGSFDSNGGRYRKSLQNLKRRAQNTGSLSFQRRFFPVLSIICALALLLNVFFIFKFHNINILSASMVYDSNDVASLEEAAHAQMLDDLESKLSSGSSVMSVLREYYPDKLIYIDNSNYVFTDINYSLRMNSLNNDNFVKSDSGEITYTNDDGTVISHKGIDLSRYQGTVDFSEVKQDQIEYAILRCGYRSYGSGVLTDDTSFTTYAEDALANDIAVGVYFFSQAINETEAIEEADYVLAQIEPYDVTYPVVIDVEEILSDEYRQQNLTQDELTNVVIAFCERIKSAGYTPMIYANLKYFAGKLDLTRLESYDKWFAYYDDEPYFPYEFSMWQYTDSGTVSGVSGSVDLNISFKTWN